MPETVTDIAPGSAGSEWTIDELARVAGLPVRTIQEYRTLGIIPAPRRQGRLGLYATSHLRRLELIARLRARGYSLAGIGDLLGNWSSGADLGEVLGLEPDQLVHVDEPGAPATLAQLTSLLPTMVPEHLAPLVTTGVVEHCGPDRFCVPSPSLLQLAIESEAAGLTPDDVLNLLGAVKRAADTVADEVVDQLERLPAATAATTTAFLQRGRGLLAHGLGRLTLYRVGRRLGVDHETNLDSAIRHTLELRGKSA